MKKYLFLFFLLYSYLAYAQYDGVVGTEGCKAIHCKDKRIVSWADNCKIIRAYQDIAKPENGFVNYGNEQNALGAVSDSDATDVVSLGDGGIAVLSFHTPIVNGDGPDFLVFENAINDVFLELAFVEVSSDSIHFIRFPASSHTPTNQQIGSFGNIDARHINNLAGKYRMAWGTPFDLNELIDSEYLDINNIKYVKIIDVVGSIDTAYASYDADGRIINDPYPTNFPSGGFDLAGVGVLHNAVSSVNDCKLITCKVYPNPCTHFINIEGECQQIVLYNAIGQIINKIDKKNDFFHINMSAYAAGVYYVGIDLINHNKKYIKIIKQH